MMWYPWCFGLFILLWSNTWQECSAKSTETLPICNATEINHGRYVNCSKPMHITWAKEDFDPYFLGKEGPGEALSFSQVWIPHNCSYHRFTNATAQRCAAHLQSQRHNVTDKPLHWIFVGDSGIRGLFCGLTRLLSGSELYGPCENSVCGGAHLPASFRELHRFFEVQFPPHITLTFVYFKTLNTRNADDVLMNAINLQPDALVFNSGAWDFDAVARTQPKKVASEECESPEMLAASQHRLSPHAKDVLQRITHRAQELHVPLIYRNNHFNARFGTMCADRDFEHYLTTLGPTWQIWDNRAVSEEVWVEQNYDGFHFDRHKVNSRQHHVGHMNFFVNKGWISPGNMETTLVQTLLHHLMHPCLHLFFGRQTGSSKDQRRTKT